MQQLRNLLKPNQFQKLSTPPTSFTTFFDFVQMNSAPSSLSTTTIPLSNSFYTNSTTTTTTNVSTPKVTINVYDTGACVDFGVTMGQGTSTN